MRGRWREEQDREPEEEKRRRRRRRSGTDKIVDVALFLIKGETEKNEGHN